MQTLPTILGWTGRPHGCMLLDDIPAELMAQLPDLGWEYTDRRPGSSTEGLTIYVPSGSGEAIIKQAIQLKTFTTDQTIAISFRDGAMIKAECDLTLTT